MGVCMMECTLEPCVLFVQNAVCECSLQAQDTQDLSLWVILLRCPRFSNMQQPSLPEQSIALEPDQFFSVGHARNLCMLPQCY